MKTRHGSLWGRDRVQWLPFLNQEIVNHNHWPLGNWPGFAMPPNYHFLDQGWGLAKSLIRKRRSSEVVLTVTGQTTASMRSGTCSGRFHWPHDAISSSWSETPEHAHLWTPTVQGRVRNLLVPWHVYSLAQVNRQDHQLSVTHDCF